MHAEPLAKNIGTGAFRCSTAISTTFRSIETMPFYIQREPDGEEPSLVSGDDGKKPRPFNSYDEAEREADILRTLGRCGYRVIRLRGAAY
jgi:hypothetical protein